MNGLIRLGSLNRYDDMDGNVNIGFAYTRAYPFGKMSKIFATICDAFLLRMPGNGRFEWKLCESLDLYVCINQQKTKKNVMASIIQFDAKN